MLIVLLIISILISISLCLYCYYLLQGRTEIVQLNTQQQKENEKIKEENKQLEAKREILKSGIWAQQDSLKSLSETKKQLEVDAKNEARQIYKTKLNELMLQIEQKKLELTQDYEKTAAQFNQKIKQQQEELSNIEAKQLAYIQAQQRREAIAANQDYYRLVLDKDDLDDVKLLRDIQKRMIRKDSIDKIIWDIYYKPAYDTLVSHFFNGTQKICGIYRITDQISGASYVGQSVDIRERWRQHIKTALSHGKATNKLYQAMQKDGVENFTFEILEEVSRDKLNERETYWIEFYKTKEAGMNSTRGGS